MITKTNHHRLRLQLASYGISGLSISTRVIYGLFLYPYRTVQELVGNRVFLPIVWVPLLSFVVIKLIWYLCIRPLFGFDDIWFLNFLANWTVLFLAFWQITLLYLAWRFYMALHQK